MSRTKLDAMKERANILAECLGWMRELSSELGEAYDAADDETLARLHRALQAAQRSWQRSGKGKDVPDDAESL